MPQRTFSDLESVIEDKLDQRIPRVIERRQFFDSHESPIPRLGSDANLNQIGHQSCKAVGPTNLASLRDAITPDVLHVPDQGSGFFDSLTSRRLFGSFSRFD